MGYAPSGKSIEAVEKYLNEMVKSDESLTWVSDDPIKLSYRIRAGIQSAKVLGPAAYAKLSSKYMIQIRGKRVVAQLRDKVPSEANAVVFTGITSPLQVLTKCVEFKEEFELIFKETGGFNISQLTMIYNWCKSNKFSLIYSASSGEITVTKKEVEDIEWKPDLTQRLS